MTTAVRSPSRRPAGARTGASTRRVNKELLALHAAITSRAFVKATHRLVQAAGPHDVTYVMLHYFVEFGRLTETWASDGSTFSDEWTRGHHAHNPAHRALAAAPGRKVLTLRECFASEAEMQQSVFYRDYM